MALQIGAIVFNYQAIDVLGPLDLFKSASKAGMRSFATWDNPVDEAIIAQAPEFDFHHIGLTLDPQRLGLTVSIVPTTTVDKAPELDILFIGGPNPATFELDPRYADFIRRHVAAGKLLFTNCSGAFVIALAGVLDGKNATVNPVVYDYTKKRFPEVNWTNETLWIVDGNIWTGGGAVAGMDMVAHWLLENYSLDVLAQAARTLDFRPRDVHGEYTVL